MAEKTDVLAVIRQASRDCRAQGNTMASNELLGAAVATAELITMAMNLLEATGKTCSSWPLSDPKRSAWQDLNRSLRRAVGAHPFYGTTSDAVYTALNRSIT